MSYNGLAKDIVRLVGGEQNVSSLEHKICYKYGKEVPDYILQELLEASLAVGKLDARYLPLGKRLICLNKQENK